MTSRTTRQTRVVDLRRSHDVRSQGELLSLLSRDGVEVTESRWGTLYVGIALCVAALVFSVLGLIESR